MDVDVGGAGAGVVDVSSGAWPSPPSTSGDPDVAGPRGGVLADDAVCVGVGTAGAVGAAVSGDAVDITGGGVAVGTWRGADAVAVAPWPV